MEINYWNCDYQNYEEGWDYICWNVVAFYADGTARFAQPTWALTSVDLYCKISA